MRTLAQYHGYADKLLGVYDGAQATDKAALCRLLCAERGIDPARRRVLLVDDHLPNLLAVRPLGVRGYLAGWGYCDPATQHLVPRLASLEDLWTFGALP